MKTGIYPDMPEAEYHNDPCDGVPALSASVAKLLVGASPSHAYLSHPLLGGHKFASTRAQDLGTLSHAYLLGKGAEHLHVMEAVYKGEAVKDFRSAVAKDERDEAIAAGKVPILKKDHNRVARAVARITKGFVEHGFPAERGEVECSIFWVERASNGAPVQCKARLDHLRTDGCTIDDLKSTKSAKPTRQLFAQMFQLAYDVQDAAYRRAVEATVEGAAGRAKFNFWFFELEEPYPVVPVRLSGAFRAVGEARWQQAIDLWAHALQTDTWPSYVKPGEHVVAEPPAWAMEDAIIDEGSEAA